MEIRKLICLACLAGALVAVNAYADPITGSGVWQEFPLTLESDGTPFVDVPSRDALRGNIAYFLSGLDGAYPGRSPHVTPEWYGDGAGGAVTNYYLNLASYELTATLLLENTEWRDLNEFGWYDASNPTVLHRLFAGTDAVGASVTFTPSAQYGYYLVSALGPTYTTQSGLNPSADTDHQHFAVFRASAAEPDRMWIGVEDLPQSLAADEMGGDYNDFVVEIVGTPEPATGMVAGGGCWRWRWDCERRVRRNSWKQVDCRGTAGVMHLGGFFFCGRDASGRIGCYRARRSRTTAAAP